MNKSKNVYSDTDLLTWIGGSYPTIDAYIREAEQQGCSRRMPGMMNWIVPGKTRIYLAHKNDNKNIAYGSIFGYYIVNSIHHIYNDVEWGMKKPFKDYQPILTHPIQKFPTDIPDFEEYIVKHKIVIVHRKTVRKKDPTAELLDELWKEWLKEAIKRINTQKGIRRIPLSFEASNLERACGGASTLGSGRYPGVYISDQLGDWILDQILDLVMDDEPSEDYFWEEVIVEGKSKRVRRKHKKVEQGRSRNGRINLDEIHNKRGKPPTSLSGIVVFEKPYPLYYHPPRAAFRGVQRIDGESLLLKVNLLQYI